MFNNQSKGGRDDSSTFSCGHTCFHACWNTGLEAQTAVFVHQFSDIFNAQGTLKGLLPEQLVAMDCRIMLSNTYHLGNRSFSKDEQQFVQCCMKSFHFNTKILGRVLKSWKQLGVFTSIQKQNHSNSHFKSSISSIFAQMSHAKVYGLAKITPHRLRRFSDGLTPRGLVFLHPIVPLTDIF